MFNHHKHMRKNASLVLFVASGVLLAVGAGCGPAPLKGNRGPAVPSRPPGIVTPAGQTLDLSNHGLTSVPKDVFDRTDLRVLLVSYNLLTGALPSEIGRLKKLKILDASHNAMTGVPAEIGQLTELTTLNLAYNQLTGLPLEIGNLKNLTRLDLSGNDISGQDLDAISSMLPDTSIIITSRR